MSSVDDAIAILGCFSMEESALTQAELTRRIDRPKATVSRVMRSLRETGILEFDPSRRLYSPGIRLFELGQICLSNYNFLDLVSTRLKDICAIGGHTGYITVFDGAEIVVIRVLRGTSPLAITTEPGYRTSSYGTSNGRAMLALLSDDEWQRRVPEPLPYISATTPADHLALLDKINSIRETGRSYASSETLIGVSSQGIAMRDPDSHEIIGVSISYPTSMGSGGLKDKLDRLLGQMKADLTRHANGDV